jgi:hypothetical protein
LRSAFARELPASADDHALPHGVRALREREHGIVTRAPSPGPRAVTKLLLIIDDCPISATASLQKRHTLGDNARWETLSACQQILPNRHMRVGGYPGFPLKEIAVCRTAYLESDRKDLVFGPVPRVAGVSFQIKFAAACRLRRPISFAQICKLIQNIMTQLGDPTRSTPARSGATRFRAARAKSLQGAGAVLFSTCLWATSGFQ